MLQESEPSELIELSFSDEEKYDMVRLYIAEHFRPVSISIFEDTINDGLEAATTNAVVNDMVNQILEMVIDNKIEFTVPEPTFDWDVFIEYCNTPCYKYEVTS